jgi:hypothetical protein
MQESDPQLSFKKNNLHEHVQRRSGKAQAAARP